MLPILIFDEYIISHDECVQIKITELNSPAFCEVVSVLVGVALGKVPDCDLLSADTTSTMYIHCNIDIRKNDHTSQQHSFST